MNHTIGGIVYTEEQILKIIQRDAKEQERNRKKSKANYKSKKAVPAPEKAPEPVPVMEEAKQEPVKAPEQVVKPRLRVTHPNKAQRAPEPIVKRKAPLGVKRPKLEPSKTMTYEQADLIIQTSPSIIGEGSRVTYRDHLKRVYEILNCDNLMTCFTDPVKAIDDINQAKQKRFPTKTYSINSKKAYIQMILKLAEVLAIPLTPEAKQIYTDAFEVLKVDSKKQTKERIESDQKQEGISFENYLPKVVEIFGEESKEHLITLLYSAHGFRDDLQLRILQEPADNKENQIIVPPSGPVQIILNAYKTENRYKQKIITLPAEIGKEVRSYIKRKDLELNDYLFGNKLLSGFVSKMNKKMDIKGSINIFRRFHVPSELDEMPSKERVELAKKMGHSTASTSTYKRNKK